MASSPNWNGFISKIASRSTSRESQKREYLRLPTQEPTIRPRALSLTSLDSEAVPMYSSMTCPNEDREKVNVPRKTRHSMQMGALRELEAQVLLTDPLENLEKIEDMAEEPELEHEGLGGCRFVEKSWFQGVSALVIILNVITTIMEMDKPATKDLFFIPDQLMLSFYVMELFLRIGYFGSLFLFGPCKLVCWNILDIVVVVAGVLDQWLMPVLPAGKDEGSVSKVLEMMRLLRLLRVFKIVRVFLEMDLSWTEAPAFQSFIGIVILINSLLMGMEIDIPWSGWFYFEQVLLVIYVFELSVRLKNFGRRFFSPDNADITWNTLDFIIVCSSVVDSWLTPLCKITMKNLEGPHMTNHKKESGMSLGKVMMLMRMLRLMRILRLAKLVKSVRPLFILVTGVMAALQGVVWVLVLTIVTLYAMGILATSLIGKKMAFPPEAEVPETILKPFNSVPNSMFTLFRVMSGAASDSEQVAIDDLMDNCPSIKLGFVFFMITSSWTLLSILTAVVSENMISTTGQQEEEIKIQNAEEDRIEHVQKLKEVFHTIDTRGDGQVEKRDIENFLCDKNNQALTARSCRVPVRDVREVLQTVAEACDTSYVNLETFVDYLADVSNVVTEKSVMKIESRLTSLTKKQTEDFTKLNSTLKAWHEERHSTHCPEWSVQLMSRVERAVEASSKAFQSKVEEASKKQLKEVEKLVQGLAERTEACLNEIQQNQLNFFQRLPQQIDQELHAPHPRPDSPSYVSPRTQTNGAEGPPEASAREKEDQPVAVNKSWADAADKGSSELHGRGPPEAIEKEDKEQPAAVTKNQTSVADVTRAPVFHMEMSVATVALEKFSETLEFELHMMKQALLYCLGQQSPDIFKARSVAGSDNTTLLPVVEIPTDLVDKVKGSPLLPVVEIPDDLVGTVKGVQMEVSAVHTEALLLANELAASNGPLGSPRIPVVISKVEALLAKVVDQRLSALAVDKYAEALEQELRTMRQEFLSSLGSSSWQDRVGSRSSDGLEKETGLVATDASSIAVDQEASVTEILSFVEGNNGSSPGV